MNNNEELEAILENLNETQKYIVTSDINSTIRIFASPGSGKTKILTRRFAYLANILKVKVSKILIISQNENASNFMVKRISRFFKQSIVNEINAHTFVTLCGKILREDIDKIGIANNYILMDFADKRNIIKQIFRHLNLKEEGTINVEDIFNYISNNKIKNINPEDLLLNAKNKNEKLKAQIYISYEKYLIKNHSLDYDCLILNTFKLFLTNPKIVQKWQKYFSHILIDEFQDIGFLEYEILKFLGKDIPIMIVGDMDQTIFLPKNTNINYMLEFHKFFPKTQTIILNQNYRSNKTIIEAANKLINFNKNRPPKEMFTENNIKEDIVFQHAFSPDAEARWVIHKINELKRSKVQLKDIAIFYRSNFYSKSFEDELIRNKINYSIVDGNKFYERDEVKDCLAFFRLISDNSAAALLRVLNVPNRNISPNLEKKLLDYSDKKNLELFQALCEFFKDPKKEFTTKLKLQWNDKNKLVLKSLVDLLNSVRKYSKALETHPIHKTLHFFLKDINYFEYIKDDEYNENNKLKNVNELLNSIKKWEEKNHGKKLSDFLDEISLLSTQKSLSLSKNYISLMSAYNTKGTEFKNVFIVGLSEYVWPSFKSISAADQNDEDSEKFIENERRLAYIAVTRAKEKLFLSDSQGLYGSDLKIKKRPSRFLTELGIDLNKYITNNYLDENEANKNNLEVGIIVMHDIFGEGTVMEVLDDTVTVAFRDPHNAKILKKNHPALRKAN